MVLNDDTPLTLFITPYLFHALCMTFADLFMTLCWSFLRRSSIVLWWRFWCSCKLKRAHCLVEEQWVNSTSWATSCEIFLEAMFLKIKLNSKVHCNKVCCNKVHCNKIHFKSYNKNSRCCSFVSVISYVETWSMQPVFFMVMYFL